MNFLLKYLISLITFLSIDFIWLSFIAKNIYQQKLGFIMAENINWPSAISFYLLFVLGIIFFVVNPALEKNNIYYAIYAGAFFGLITYATYDLTNLATLKNWPLSITIIDLIWGSVLTAIVSFVTYLICSKF